MRLFRVGAVVAGLIAASLHLASPGFANHNDDDTEIGCALRIWRQGGPIFQAGSDDDDHCTGYRGVDRIRGNGGEDYLSGHRGWDAVRGNRGDDRVRGGRGTDLVAGGKGDDKLAGGRGDDLLVGGIGHDDFCLGPGRNIVRAEDHRRDRIFGAGSNDRLFLDPGDRLLERHCPF